MSGQGFETPGNVWTRIWDPGQRLDKDFKPWTKFGQVFEALDEVCTRIGDPGRSLEDNDLRLAIRLRHVPISTEGTPHIDSQQQALSVSCLQFLQNF